MPTHTATSGREFAVGDRPRVAGALLFALPLLMTMEMWWLGFHMEPWRLILMLALSSRC